MIATRIIPAIDSASGEVSDLAIAEADELLRTGQVVAFPTETVYGLGANALDADAVARIFEAKGRPANNPVIVHVENIEQARSLTSEWPDLAEKFARTFWPGPLTLVLKKTDIVPGIVTSGGDTVAIRCPDHLVALELIRSCGFPLAAPSANISNFISPTTAEHVVKSLNGRIPLVLDGGPSLGGIESTVVSVNENGFKILRPGIIGRLSLEKCSGLSVREAGEMEKDKLVAMSPGQLPVHYAPRTPLLLVETDRFENAYQHLRRLHSRIGLMRLQRERPEIDSVYDKEMPMDPEKYSNDLYATLHQLDDLSLDIILCELPRDLLEWQAVLDRLSRAGKRFIV